MPAKLDPDTIARDIVRQVRQMGAQDFANGDNQTIIHHQHFFGPKSLAYQHWIEGWERAALESYCMKQNSNTVNRLHYKNNVIINASAHQIPLADKSIHAVVTSPPYFGLRKYEGAQDVNWPTGSYTPMTGCPPCVDVPAMRCPLGNEPTIEAFIYHLLIVLRECRRVLRDDGVAWVNLGDSYSGSGRGGNPEWLAYQKQRTNNGSITVKGERWNGVEGGNLLGIPHRFALAAQADGWVLRNDCVWAKKSAMPESVTGWRFQDGQLRRGSWRHTRAHEYVFQLVKGMGYWSDSEIVKEASDPASDRRLQRGVSDDHKMLDVPGRSTHTLHKSRVNGDGYSSMGSRNPRSVFSPSPSSYTGAHFATFPKELIRPLILSSVPRRCCPQCGQGWAATVESKPMVIRKTARAGEVGRTQTSGTMLEPASSKITGYQPTCDCGREDYKPGIALDPFVGSGTTLEVARECGVQSIGLDISHTYLNEQASWRGMQEAKPDFSKMPLFAGTD